MDSIDQYMEESVAGFKEKGDWDTIVEHGDRITEALTDENIEGSDFEEWKVWWPKVDERLNEDVKEKTAELASTSEGEGEKVGTSPEEDVSAAGEKLKESVSELAEGDFDDALKKGRKLLGRAARAADTAGRKALRTVEEPVYEHVMTKVSPVYFDNELVSANIERTRDTDEPYAFEVNINDDDLKDCV